MWGEWVRYTSLLEMNVQTVTLSDSALLSSAAERSLAFYNYAQQAMDIVESECLSRSSGVKCSLLRKLGRQRVLLQKVNMEAFCKASA